MALTKRDILTAALRELGALDPVEVMSDEEAAIAGDQCDRLYDQWNADRKAVYASALSTYTLTPNLNPHTIGPGGTFNVTQRPVELEACGLLLSGAIPVRRPIHIRDKQWYAGVSAKTIGTPIPTDVWYDPDWPLGKLYFRAVPTAAYQVELLTRVVLTALNLNDTFTLPPGAREAVTLTLAEKCAKPFGRPISPDLRLAAREARALYFGNNTAPPRIATRDFGMPGRRGAGKMNWLNREIV